MQFLGRVIAVALVMGVSSFSGISMAAQPLNRVIASVNNEAITQAQLDRKTGWIVQKMVQNGMPRPAVTELQKQVLEKLIVERVQLDLAKRLKIDVTDEIVQSTIQNVAKQEGLTVGKLKAAVAEDGLSFKEFEDNIRVELVLSRLQQQALADQVTVSDQEIEHFLKSHPESTEGQKVEYRLRHILLPLAEDASDKECKQTLAEAMQLLKRVREGAKFSQLALDYSKGPQALQGGDLGWRVAEALPTLFVKPMANLAVGEAAGPIKNDSGYHLIYLEEKRIGGKPEQQAGDKMIQRRQQALSTLYEQKFEIVLRRWIKRMRDEAQIESFL